jgi:hypothetical protein
MRQTQTNDWFAEIFPETPTTEAERKLAYYKMVLRCDVGHNGVSEQDKIDAAKYFETTHVVQLT